ncbi:MAG: DUF493 domain-containing protein [Candidatus Omnitrophica bacterium]|nr:DUF493 domain-containing protein [Candidatus Omnitrophota bacterium]MBU4332944.1 DUF493 domain-containing protein [Candidatus Omnitrophota bacterium]
MSNKKTSNQELQFPIACHYRIIAVDIPNIDKVIETVLQKFEVLNALQEGNQSRKGKYLSFGVDINIKSKEEMRQVNSELLKVEGVKMVL